MAVSESSSVLGPLGNAQPLKLGTFAQNTSGGTTITLAEGTLRGDWRQQLEVATSADAAGWEFLLPLARWRSFGGPSDFAGKSFEVFTWAAGIAAATKQIQVIATAHVPIFHPLLAAKQGATVDHIAGGRFGLNVVVGWNAAELKMFGLEQVPHDERYRVGEEWLTIVKRLWTEEEDLNFEGDYYTIRDGQLRPKPLSQPRPVLVNAGQSPVGMRFAAKNMDFAFQVHPEMGGLADLVTQVRHIAHHEFQREIGVLSYGYVVCADTKKEAQDYLHYYVEEKGDYVAAQNLINESLAGDTKSLPSEVLAGMQRALVAGWGGLPLVGTPEQIVDELLKVHALGVEGIALTWVNYNEGIAQFNEQVLPLLEQAGLRHPVPQVET